MKYVTIVKTFSINNISRLGYNLSNGTSRPYKFKLQNFSFDTQRNKKRFVILLCLLTYYTAQQIHKQAEATLLLSKFLINNWSENKEQIKSFPFYISIHVLFYLFLIYLSSRQLIIPHQQVIYWFSPRKCFSVYFEETFGTTSWVPRKCLNCL